VVLRTVEAQVSHRGLTLDQFESRPREILAQGQLLGAGDMAREEVREVSAASG
jgi:hypothetical protein